MIPTAIRVACVTELPKLVDAFEKLADAFERYENNRVLLGYYRDQILPDINENLVVELYSK